MRKDADQGALCRSPGPFTIGGANQPTENSVTTTHDDNNQGSNSSNTITQAAALDIIAIVMFEIVKSRDPELHAEIVHHLTDVVSGMRNPAKDHTTAKEIADHIERIVGLNRV